MQLPWCNLRKLTAFGSLLVVAVAVSACGGSSSSSSSSSQSTPTTTESTPTTAPATMSMAGSGGAVTAAAGKKVFAANCGSCHTLAAAGTNGNVGPNLDDLKPDMAMVVHQVTNGGGGMPAFASQFSKTEIQSVAKYVSSAAGKGGSNSSSEGSGLPSLELSRGHLTHAGAARRP
jgi:cytochrome c2